MRKEMRKKKRMRRGREIVLLLFAP